MRLWSHAAHVFPLPDGHRYPLGKYRLLLDRLLDDGVVAPDEVRVPEPMAWDDLERVHDPDFVARMREGRLDRREERVLGLPWSPQLVERARRGATGTLQAARDALSGQGVGMMLGGGTHHAGRATARGYCLFNDLALTTEAVRREGVARRVMVVDCDVHQGDGTAELLGPDPEAYTLSLHGARNYPFKRIPSDLDVDLPTGTGDDGYLAALDDALDTAWARFGPPDLLLYLAGADPWTGDRLGRLALTKPGLAARDELVLARAAADDVPVAVTLAGGYPPELADGVDINAATATLAAAMARRAPAPTPTTPRPAPGRPA